MDYLTRDTVMKNTNRYTAFKLTALSLAVNALLLTSASLQAKDDINKFYGDFRLRYENVSQDNPLPNANGLTLRIKLGFKTRVVEGFTDLIEVENNTALIDDYSVPPTGDRVGEFSVIAEPEGTEIDQAFIAHKG